MEAAAATKKPADTSKGEDGKNLPLKSIKSPPRLIGVTPFPTPTSPIMPIVSFTDKDIFVPINEAVISRPANKEYMDLMKANCFIFHSLPGPDQVWFVRNLTHFVTTVRGRRWIAHFGYPMRYQLLTDASNVVQTDFRMDPLKVAAFQFHPFWLLGEHDPSNAHNGAPFVHRTLDGTWKAVTTAQVKDILKGEGPKNLLLLPPSIQLSSEATEKGEHAEPPVVDTTEHPGKKQKSDDDAKVKSRGNTNEKLESNTDELQKPESSKAKIEAEKPEIKADQVENKVGKADTKDESKHDGSAEKRERAKEKTECKLAENIAEKAKSGKDGDEKTAAKKDDSTKPKDNNDVDQVEIKTKSGKIGLNEPKEKSAKDSDKSQESTKGEKDHGELNTKAKGDGQQTKSKKLTDKGGEKQRRSKRTRT